MTKIDFSETPQNHSYTIKLEKEEDPSDAWVRRFKEVTIFLLAIGSVVLIATLCVNTLSSPSASAEEKKWAMSIITAAAGGIIGYLLKK